MKTRTMATASIVTALVLGVASGADANSTGIPGKARIGCGGVGCHGGVIPPNTTTQLLIQGVEDGYAPGCHHELTIWVLGVAFPAPLGTLPMGGFNLEVTAGTLEEERGVVEVWPELDGRVLQATHAYRVPLNANEPNRFMWQVHWTAPAATSGPVTFYLAGNVVNGNAINDIGDQWSFLEGGTEVPENPQASCPSQ